MYSIWVLIKTADISKDILGIYAKEVVAKKAAEEYASENCFSFSEADNEYFLPQQNVSLYLKRHQILDDEDV